MSDGLSDNDRSWLESRFKALQDDIRGQGSSLNKVSERVIALELGAVHKCAEAIEKHEAGSWAHSPYKAGGLLVAVLGVVEGVKKIFSGH